MRVVSHILSVLGGAFGRRRPVSAIDEQASLLVPETLLLRLAASDVPALDDLGKAQLALLVRVLATLPASGDQNLTLQGERLLRHITEIMPEAPVLLALHEIFGSGRNATWYRPETRIDLSALHAACHEARPVSFEYTDLRGNHTRRRVRPLELVHPHHGILLLAWCELRQAPRKFYVHAMDRLQIHDEDFSAQRLALLMSCLDEEIARREGFETAYAD